MVEWQGNGLQNPQHGFRLRGTTQIPSTLWTIADCGLMILDRQFVIRFFIDIAWSSGKARICKTLSMGFRLRGTTQIPSTPLIIADCGLMILDRQFVIRFFIDIAWSSGKATVCKPSVWVSGGAGLRKSHRRL